MKDSNQGFQHPERVGLDKTWKWLCNYGYDYQVELKICPTAYDIYGKLIPGVYSLWRKK